jgi:3-hydroxy-9,10-secoandrosta-1,3,5(10)-triene-9,17-dione monooxygenase reductase component
VTQLSIPSNRAADSRLDEAALRETLGHFCSGVTVLSSNHDGEPIGMTCQSFFSVSLDPPMVAFCVGRGSKTFPLIRETGSCVVNILSEAQGDLSTNFARSGVDKFADVKWNSSKSRRHPKLGDALAWIECDIEEVINAGDHYLVLANVIDFERESEKRPLLYFRSSYARLHSSSEREAL